MICGAQVLSGVVYVYVYVSGSAVQTILSCWCGRWLFSPACGWKPGRAVASRRITVAGCRCSVLVYVCGFGVGFVLALSSRAPMYKSYMSGVVCRRFSTSRLRVVHRSGRGHVSSGESSSEAGVSQGIIIQRQRVRVGAASVDAEKKRVETRRVVVGSLTSIFAVERSGVRTKSGLKG